MPKKQADGRYRAKVIIGHDENGKEIVKYATGRTTKELDDAKRQLEEYYITGMAPEPDMLFGQYAVDWYHTRKEPFLRSDAQKRNYRTTMNKHVLPAFGERNLRAISAIELQRWINQYTGKSKTTIDDCYNLMRNIMASAFSDGIIQRDPSAKLIKPLNKPPKQRRALTEAERVKIKEAIHTAPHGDFLGVLYYLGVRRGEALGLRWGDFDWEDNLVHIQRDIDYATKKGGEDNMVGALKTPSSDRFIPIPADLRAILLPHRGLPQVYLFRGERSGEPVSKATQERMWIELMLPLGFVEPRPLPEGKKWLNPDVRMLWTPTITPHFLRHNYATMLWEAGMDPIAAMRILGHADYQTTAKIYTHLQTEHLKRLALNIDGVFDGSRSAARAAGFQAFVRGL